MRLPSERRKTTMKASGDRGSCQAESRRGRGEGHRRATGTQTLTGQEEPRDSEKEQLRR